MNSPRIFRASFRTGITLKGIDGLLEAIGGVLLWFIKPEQLGTTLREIFEHELVRARGHEHALLHHSQFNFEDLLQVFGAQSLEVKRKTRTLPTSRLQEEPDILYPNPVNLVNPV